MSLLLSVSGPHEVSKAMKCITEKNSSGRVFLRRCRPIRWVVSIVACIFATGSIAAPPASERYTHAICKGPYDNVVDWHADHAAATSEMTDEDREAGKPLCPHGPGPADGYPWPADPPVVPVATFRAALIRLINSIDSLDDTTPERVAEVLNLAWEPEELDERSSHFGRLDDEAYGGVSVYRRPQRHRFAIRAAINEFSAPAQCSIEADDLVKALVEGGWTVSPSWTTLEHGELGRLFSKDLPEQKLRISGDISRWQETRASRYCFSQLVIRTGPLDATP